ncbi:TIM44-like domain-containing protein [Xanthobacter sp. TB0139]|uniref:TIM44-like domain-containing protein n=1 Tax=Xanthobacter sp. TB0139 TaxID=3459178 RepID=UPI0040392CF5
MGRSRWFLAMFAIVSAVMLVGVDHAEARRGGSFGSRGARTFQAPRTTPTAPQNVAPVQRSTTQQPGMQSQQNRAAGARQAGRSSMFGGGLMGGLMRGMLIGGLIGLLMGQGLGGLAGLFGLLVQGLLIALVVMLVMRFLRRPQPAAAGGRPSGMARAAGGDASGGMGTGAGSGLGSALGGLGRRPGHGMGAGLGAGLGSGLGTGASGASAAPRRNPAQPDEIGLSGGDFDQFEKLLATILTAFGREDQGALREHTTDEVFSYFSDEMRQNAEQGHRNVVSDVKLLQGDLSEAWREDGREYATVAMRFASFDRMVDRNSGAYISGDQDQPGESTELWTFVRENRGPWKLSAIQGA